MYISPMNNYPAIILVAPQMGENIGACARAMKNFGLKSLRIVAPRDGWPNEKAESTSVGAIDLIKNAGVFESLEDAIADLEFVYATTGIKRNMNKPYVLTKNLASEFPYESKVGIMFGRENWGLNNDEIALANKIITIDTDPDFTSLNIAQAVLVVSYEIFKAVNRLDLANEGILATRDDLTHFHAHLFKNLEEADFFKAAEKKDQMQRNIINIFSRIDSLTRIEIQTLRGILKALEN